MNSSVNNTKFVAVFLGSNHLENALDLGKQLILKPIELNLNKHASDLLNIVVSDKSNRRINSNKIIQYLEINNPTKGALLSLSFALDLIPDDIPVLVIPNNSYVDFSISNFIKQMNDADNALGLVAFKSKNSKYSYLRVKNKNVIEFREKELVGDLATAGIFYFKNRREIANCTEWCLLNNIQKNGNFYLAPSLNYFICNNSNIGIFEIQPASYYRIENVNDLKLINVRSLDEKVSD
jgi:hypothetical protein